MLIHGGRHACTVPERAERVPGRARRVPTRAAAWVPRRATRRERARALLAGLPRRPIL